MSRHNRDQEAEVIKEEFIKKMEELRKANEKDEIKQKLQAAVERNKTLPAGGLKFDSEKPRYDLLSQTAIHELSQVLTFGAQKYAAHNWRQGIAQSRLLAATLRHVFAYLDGEDLDSETGLCHIAHAMCCCMFLLELRHTRKDLDDRFKTGECNHEALGAGYGIELNKQACKPNCECKDKSAK